MVMQAYATRSDSSPTTLLELHKLMYLLQEAGELLKLRYEKGRYGPFATNLRHLLLLIEGHFLSGFRDNGDVPTSPLSVIPQAVDNAAAVIENTADTRKRLDQVIGLVDDYATPAGLELLTTVHWVVTREQAVTIDQAI